MSAIKTIIFPVRDVAAAKGLFTELVGAEPYADMPYYVGYRIGDQEIGLEGVGVVEVLLAPLFGREVGAVAVVGVELDHRDALDGERRRDRPRDGGLARTGASCDADDE